MSNDELITLLTAYEKAKAYANKHCARELASLSAMREIKPVLEAPVSE